MQKPIYIFLILITVALIGYTLYYTLTHQESTTLLIEGSQVASTTSLTDTLTSTSTEVQPKNILTTKSGKTIQVDETNPNGESLSTVVITPTGFASNTPITLEINKLKDFFLADLNNDSFDELILISQTAGSGSYGEAFIYTTLHDQGLLLVSVPQLQEEDVQKGGLFEGYMGHDIFTINNSTLTREFPTYTASDTESSPSGPAKKIIYSLVIKGSSTPSVIFTENKDPKTLEKVQ